MSFGRESNLFSDNAKLYANPNVRPVYSPELFERVYDFCEAPREVALDVATGSGQSAKELAKVFQQVRVRLLQILLEKCNAVHSRRKLDVLRRGVWGDSPHRGRNLHL